MVTFDELRQKFLERANRNRENYKRLYHLCEARIRHLASSTDPIITRCTWTVPPITLGLPNYNTKHAARYINDKLLYNGFQVSIDDDKETLNISWDAVTHPAQRRHRKKKKKKKRERLSLAEKAARAEHLTVTLRN